MSDDIVARLRGGTERIHSPRDRYEAADEIERLRAELAAERERKSAPPYVFRRFKSGNEMAEGVIIENAETLEHAIVKAARFYPGTGTVFVIEDVDARKERDALRAVLAFYADPPSDEQVPDFYSELDFGSRARAALKGDGDE